MMGHTYFMSRSEVTNSCTLLSNISETSELCPMMKVKYCAFAKFLAIGNMSVSYWYIKRK